MAQSILSIAQQLTLMISNEADFLSGVQDQVQLLSNEIRLMRSALRDASEKRRTIYEVEEWLNQVRDVVMEAEDVIDFFIFRGKQQRHRYIPTRYICYPILLSNLHKLGKQIENSNIKIDKLTARRSMLGLATSEAVAGQSSNEQRQPFHRRDEQGLPFRGRDSVEEFSVIGLEEEENEIVKKLQISIKASHPFPTVVSMVGMGGSGKTTLARKVYKNKAVVEHFPTRAWVSVSQQLVLKDILQVLIEQIQPLTSEEKRELDEGSLIHKLSSLLKEKTYLIVFDDLWRNEHWDKLKQALPVQEEGNHQSRVMVTTRNEAVARHADPFTDPYHQHLLTEEESWKLFLTKVMGSKDASCPQDLEDLGRKIVSKCHGLPLAIVVLGGLLSTKPPTHLAWSKVHSSVSWELNQNEGSCRQVLALSYSDLPDHLKPCFLYLGLFPEDTEIEFYKLIRLWVAEGFIQPREQWTIEDVAEDYLEEFIQRSIIQATSRDYDGRVMHCRIHDLVLDLAISEAKKERFLEVVGIDNLTLPIYKSQRISIIGPTGVVCGSSSSTNALNQGIALNHLRSLLWFYDYSPERNTWMKSLVGAMNLLRVLDLEGLNSTLASSFLRQIGRFILLKYLSLRTTYIEELPSSIGDLQNLQTLDLRETDLTHLPMRIMKLQQLRNLLFRRYPSASKNFNIYPGPDLIRNLQVLMLGPGKWIGKLNKLTNLRELSILLDTQRSLSTYEEELLNAIPKLIHLRSLKFLEYDIQLYCPENPTVLTVSFSCHSDLSLMVLTRIIGIRNFPPNLTTLFLHSQKGQGVNELMANLKCLRKLRCLILHRAYLGSKINFSADGFYQLQELTLTELQDLEEFTMEEGALQNLRVLRISLCGLLKRLPHGLKQVGTLRELIISETSEEFEHRIREVEGEDWEIIKYIPFVKNTDWLSVRRAVEPYYDWGLLV